MHTYEMSRCYLLKADTPADVLSMFYSVYPFLRNDRQRPRTKTYRRPNGYWMHWRIYRIEAASEEAAESKFYEWYPQLKNDSYLDSFEIKLIEEDTGSLVKTAITQVSYLILGTGQSNGQFNSKKH